MRTIINLVAVCALLLTVACNHPTFNPNAPSNPAGSSSVYTLYTFFSALDFPANDDTAEYLGTGPAWATLVDGPGTLSGQVSISPDSPDDLMYIFLPENYTIGCAHDKSQCSNYLWSGNVNPRQFSIHVPTAKLFMVFWNTTNHSVTFQAGGSINFTPDK